MEPNAPDGWVLMPALGAAAVAAGATGAVMSADGAAGAPDVSLSVIVFCFCLGAHRGAGAAWVE